MARAWATAPVTEAGLVRLLMTPAVVGRAVPGHEALGALAAIRRVSGWHWLTDDASFDDALVDTRVLDGRRQVTELHLADLAARHDAVLVTFDGAVPQTLAPADRRHVVV